MNGAGIIRRGLWLPIELYLQPERFRQEVDALAGGRDLTIWRAFRLARAEPSARPALADLLGRVVLALAWPFMACALLDLGGVPITWVGVALMVAFEVAVGIAMGYAGTAFGVAFGVAYGVALGVAVGVSGGVAFGVASGVASGVAFGVASGVVVGFASGVAFGVAVGVVVAVALGVAIGVASGVAIGVAFGVASGVAVGVVGRRLLLAPVDVLTAQLLRRRLLAGESGDRVWRFHPARWDPHGRFPLPGLAVVLADLQVTDPVLAVEANRIVAANPTRRPALSRAAVLVADRLVERATSIPALAALDGDLRVPVDEAALPVGEATELRLLRQVSGEVAAAQASDSLSNRRHRLQAAAGALDSVNAGSAVLARHRRRLTDLVDQALLDSTQAQREQEPVPAVFRVDGLPLGLHSSELFKGRTRVFARIEELLGAGERTTLIVHGPRRHGKSSILKQLPARLGPSAIPVFVDLQSGLGSADTAAAFLAGLAGEVVEQAEQLRHIGGLPALGPGEPYPAFGQWLTELEQAIGDRHVLLCLDEFEKIQEQIDGGRLDTRVLDLLRNIAQHHPKITVVLTGVDDLPELPAAWASKLVNATSLEVGPLDEPDARELIVAPVPDFPPVYAGDGVAAILDATACQPFLVQALCAELVAGLNRRHWQPGDPVVTAGAVNGAMEGAAARVRNYFLDVWRDQVPDDAKALVRDLARLPATTSDPATVEGLRESILVLERRHVVRRTDAGLALEAPLFGEYVRRFQSLPS